MTVTTNLDTETFDGDGVVTSFPFSVKAQETSHIKATHITTGLVKTKLVLDTDYSVSLNADGTSTITFPLGGSAFSVLATGEDLELRRIVPLTQTLSLGNHGAYNPDAVEKGMDRIVQAIQQISPDSPSANGNIIYFDSDGDPQKGITYSELLLLADATNYFDVPVAYSASSTYTTSQTTVIESGVVYAPLYSALPIGPEAFNAAHWYIVQGYISGSSSDLDVGGALTVSNAANYPITVESTTAYAGITFGDNTTTSNGCRIVALGDELQLRTLNTTGLTIDANQKVVVGGNLKCGSATDITPNATADREQFQVQGSGYAAYIALDGANAYLGHHSSSRGLALQTNEITRMVLGGTGHIFFKDMVGLPSSVNSGMAIVGTGTNRYISNYVDVTTTQTHFNVGNTNGSIGGITSNGSATSFNTTSDPRLKSTFKPINGSIAVQMIKEASEQNMIGEFYWINDKTKDKVWGYNAHLLLDYQKGFGGTEGVGPRSSKIDTVLKKAVFEQKKDENGNPMVDDDGEPIIQEVSPEILVSPASVDQSKRVPLLEAAIYELLKRIEKLEKK